MRIHAISDLHLGSRANRLALAEVRPRPADWLIVAGDVGESVAQMELAWKTLVPRFAGVVWVPGNHELWTVSESPHALGGVEKYLELVAICRGHGVVTPEDRFVELDTAAGPVTVAPLFLHYDYSFAPDGVSPEAAVGWAVEAGIECADELYLRTDPYPSCREWCAARVAWTAQRLDRLDPSRHLILVTHYPLRWDLAQTPRIPRFIIWCGTRATEDWHRRYNARVVVSGHVHIRRTEWRDAARFEEVSLGYPHQWSRQRGINHYVREIWPADGLGSRSDGEIVWHW